MAGENNCLLSQCINLILFTNHRKELMPWDISNRI